MADTKKQIVAGDDFKSRDQLKKKFCWNLSHLYVSDEVWEEHFTSLQGELNKLDSFRGKIRRSATDLFSCLEVRSEIETSLGKLSLYASLKNDEDTRVPKYQAMRDKISILSVNVHQKIAFIEPEIISIPKPQIDMWLKEYQNLKVYLHYLEDLFRTKKYVLSQKEERILALAGDLSQNSYQVFSMFNNADLRFPLVKDEHGKKVQLTHGNFSNLMKTKSRSSRKQIFKSFYSSYRVWKNTLAASVSGAVKRDIFYAGARNYSSTLIASLDRDNIPITVYNNLIYTINQHLEPMHRYITLREKILYVNQVKPWDLFVPLIKKLKWEVEYNQAVETIKEACKPLGEEYLEILSEAFKAGWIDVYENQGKRSGAYSSSVFGINHPYVLLNYNGHLDDMFTLAHEMGHALHSYFTNRTQPYIYSNYTIFVAEVASTLNEVLLTQYLLNRVKNPQKKLYLINQHIDQIRGTVYIQTLFAEFEKKIHEKVEGGEPLTAENLTEIYSQLTERYYGQDFSMDDLYGINWCRIPHFYYNFYVYQYATGYSAAIKIASKIFKGDKKITSAYLNFLGSGNSDYSINLLKKMGVDMTSPAPIEETAKHFNGLIQNMEQLLF